uniref:Uncharacterized protein n=1 Tax=Zea mays TaxID=4577 RepID=A0A804RR46_MAIZE
MGTRRAVSPTPPIPMLEPDAPQSGGGDSAGSTGEENCPGAGRKVGTSEGPPESRKRKSYSDSDSGGDDGSDPAPDPSPFF